MKPSTLSTEAYNESIERCNKYLPKSFEALPENDVAGTTTQLKECDVFVWCDEIYLVDDSGAGMSGEVRHMDGSLATNAFYWNYQGEPCFKIGTLSREDIDSLINDYRIKKTTAGSV